MLPSALPSTVGTYVRGCAIGTAESSSLGSSSDTLVIGIMTEDDARYCQRVSIYAIKHSGFETT